MRIQSLFFLPPQGSEKTTPKAGRGRSNHSLDTRGKARSENFLPSYLFRCYLFQKGTRFSCYDSQKNKINQERNGKDGPGNKVKISRLGEDTAKRIFPESGCLVQRHRGLDCSHGSGNISFSLSAPPTPLPTPFPPKAFCRWCLSVPRTSLGQRLKDQNSKNHFFFLYTLVNA